MEWMNRGNKLWEGHRMMLPEYEEALWEARRKKERFVPPTLTEDLVMEISRTIAQGMIDELPVVITVAEKYGPKDYCGYIEKVDQITGKMKVSNAGDITWLSLDKIIDVQHVDCVEG